jgi:HNH endonuclease
MNIEEHFWSRVDKDGPMDTATGTPCWLWTGPTKWFGGYGRFRNDAVYVHRFAYELLVGPIPDGLHLDHKCHRISECRGGPSCHHRRCVNPAHLTPETKADNTRRGMAPVLFVERAAARMRNKTHCPHGHPYTGENLVINSKGSRECRTCIKSRWPKHRAQVVEEEDNGDVGLLGLGWESSDFDRPRRRW